MQQLPLLTDTHTDSHTHAHARTLPRTHCLRESQLRVPQPVGAQLTQSPLFHRHGMQHPLRWFYRWMRQHRLRCLALIGEQLPEFLTFGEALTASSSCHAWAEGLVRAGRLNLTRASHCNVRLL